MSDTPIADAVENPTEGYKIPEYPQSAIMIEGETFVGRFVRLDRSPIGYDFGQGETFPHIAVFEGVSGVIRHHRDGPGQVVQPGREYGIWLIHSVLRNALKSSRPAVGELTAIAYSGERVVRGEDPANPRARRYHAYRVAMPDREQAAGKQGWDAVEADAGEAEGQVLFDDTKTAAPY